MDNSVYVDVHIDLSSSQPGGYVGFGSLPDQVYRRAVRKGFEFTLMVVGESGLGKVGRLYSFESPKELIKCRFLHQLIMKGCKYLVFFFI